MKPATPEQLRAAFAAVDALADPGVTWNAAPVFGTLQDSDRWHPDYAKIYVDVGEWRGVLVLVLCRYFEDGSARWTRAMPPWPVDVDVPSLVEAVARIRASGPGWGRAP